MRHSVVSARGVVAMNDQLHDTANGLARLDPLCIGLLFVVAPARHQLARHAPVA